MAGPQPRQHVPGRWPLPAADRPSGRDQTQALSSGSGAGRSRDHHHGGTGNRASGKPAVAGLGLPGSVGELPGADLSPFQLFLVFAFAFFCLRKS